MEKRIKRHVIGKTHELFAASAPGIEGVLAREMKTLGVGRDHSETEGGVLFSGRIDDIFKANLCLSTANRILLRVASFSCPDFRTLEERAGEVPWELFLPPETALLVRAATHKSRLYHTGAVAERVERAITGRMAIRSPGFRGFDPESPLQQVFVRIVRDRAVLSLDTSGEPLYRRGRIGGGAKAPLRETLAAAILDLAGWDPESPLLDPLCGSGAFTLEAALRAKNVPPGQNRDFAFFLWPGFPEKRWAHIKKTCQEAVRTLDTPQIFASDRDEASVAGLSERIRGLGWTDAVSAKAADFFELAGKDFPLGPGLVVINPPYGRRLSSPQGAKRLFGRVARHVSENFSGWKAALLAPDREWVREAPFFVRARPLHHGGLTVWLLTGVAG